MTARKEHIFINDIELKNCPKCKQYLELHFFHNQKTKWDGLNVYCKECMKIRYNDNYHKYKERAKKQREKYKQNNKEKILQKNKEYNEKNKETIKIKNRERNQRKRLFFREEENLKAKIYRDKNKDKIRKNERNYTNKHRDKIRAKIALRRARKLNATPKWLTENHIKEIKEIYKNCIEISKNTGIKHHVDHIIPLKGETVCGLHVPWNLQIITESENCKKWNKLLEEYTNNDILNEDIELST